MLRLAAALVLFAFSALADDITGKVRIIDGDLDDFMAAALAARVTGGKAASGGSG